jgi:hypothetical protein
MREQLLLPHGRSSSSSNAAIFGSSFFPFFYFLPSES